MVILALCCQYFGPEYVSLGNLICMARHTVTVADGMIHFGSGTYNLRATEGFDPEQVRPRPAQQLICTVFFLDNTEKQFSLQRNALGDELLAKVFDHLELVEKDFFGLQFISALDSNATRMVSSLPKFRSFNALFRGGWTRRSR